MTDGTVAAIALLVFGWAVVSGALARHEVTGPFLFAASGYVLGNPRWGPLPVDVKAASVHVVAEVALALVLFADAARVNVHELRRDLSLPLRLLGIGLLLSMILGGLLAAGVLADVPWALAGFVGAALAATDAALSVQVIADQRIPTRLRRALNVESGLNDGIATPVVMAMLAVAASQIGVAGGDVASRAGGALRELGTGAAVGLAVGTAGAVLVSHSVRRRWIAPDGRRLAALALAVGGFALALALDGNGFIAAFVAGAAFGATLDPATNPERAVEMPELGGELLALVVWFVFGAALLPIGLQHLDVRTLGYALLSLTVVRMVPVALCLLRSGLDRPSVLFIGWFGPRGLASVVFALLAVEELGETSPAVDRVVAAVTFTVMLSVVLHGVTAGPGGRRYVRREHGEGPVDVRARRQRLVRSDQRGRRPPRIT